MLQCGAVCCDVPAREGLGRGEKRGITHTVLHCVAVCCIVVHCVAMCRQRGEEREYTYLMRLACD